MLRSCDVVVVVPRFFVCVCVCAGGGTEVRSGTEGVMKTPLIARHPRTRAPTHTPQHPLMKGNDLINYFARRHTDARVVVVAAVGDGGGFFVARVHSFICARVKFVVLRLAGEDDRCHRALRSEV